MRDPQVDLENEVSVTDKSLFSTLVSAQRLLTEVCTIALDTRLMITYCTDKSTHRGKSVLLGHLCSSNRTHVLKLTIGAFSVGGTNFKLLLTPLFCQGHTGKGRSVLHSLFQVVVTYSMAVASKILNVYY